MGTCWNHPAVSVTSSAGYPQNMADSQVYGVEIDSISGRIAGQLYQNSRIAVEGFEKVDLPDSFFDVAIGNVPFGDFKVTDLRYDRNHWRIHDYFFGKTIDRLRPGGIIAFITSKGTMDKENPCCPQISGAESRPDRRCSSAQQCVSGKRRHGSYQRYPVPAKARPHHRHGTGLGIPGYG